MDLCPAGRPVTLNKFKQVPMGAGWGSLTLSAFEPCPGRAPPVNRRTNTNEKIFTTFGGGW